MTPRISPQENWQDIRNLLKKYMLNTSLPLIFNEVIRRPYLMRNKGYDDYAATRKVQMEAAGRRFVRESHDWSAWENMWKKSLIDVFVHRLLGSQGDLASYWLRSEKYRKLLSGIFGRTEECIDMKTLTDGFMDMLKDYLVRNMTGLSENGQDMDVYEVLVQCRTRYEKYRTADFKDYKLVDFGKQTYGGALLDQMEAFAKDTGDHPKCRHYLVIMEYINTLFIYVYMVEYTKLYPYVKGERYIETDTSKREREYNLFKELERMDFMKEYRMLKEEE